MFNMIKAEHLKQKSTFQKVLIWLGPTITLLLVLVLMGGNYIQSGGYNWWYMFILPASLTMISSFVINNDSKRTFHGLFSVVIDKDKIFPKAISLLLTGVTSKVDIVPRSFSPAIDSVVTFMHPVNNIITSTKGKTIVIIALDLSSSVDKS